MKTGEFATSYFRITAYSLNELIYLNYMSILQIKSKLIQFGDFVTRRTVIACKTIAKACPVVAYASP